MFKEKRILITGSNGFIGKSLSSRLKKFGCDVIEVDRANGIDLKDDNKVNALPDVDIIFHLAAFNGTKWFYEKPLDVVLDNTLPTLNLINRYKDNCELFIFAGTCESYAGSVEHNENLIPTPETVPLSINDITNPRWSYGGSKIGNEVSIIAANKQHNMNFQIIRYHNIYGPSQKDHFFPEFIERVKNNNFDLVGYENTRSFLYIDDAVTYTIELALNKNAYNQIINIGSDDEISIKDAAELILKKMNIDNKLNLSPAPLGSVLRRLPCTKKLKSLCQHKDLVNFDNGIEMVINHLVKN